MLIYKRNQINGRKEILDLESMPELNLNKYPFIVQWRLVLEKIDGDKDISQGKEKGRYKRSQATKSEVDC